MSKPTAREPHQSAQLARHRPRIAQVLGGAVLTQSRRLSFRSWRRAAARTARSRNTLHTSIQQPCVSCILWCSPDCSVPGREGQVVGSNHTSGPRRSSFSCIALPVITPSTSTVGRRVSLCQVISDELGKDALAEGFKSKICEVCARRVSTLAWSLSDPQQRELAAHGPVRP